MSDSILAIIPVSGFDETLRGGVPEIEGRNLLDFTFEAARNAKSLSRCVVSTDSEEIAAHARAFGLEVPPLRPRELQLRPVIEVLQFAHNQLTGKSGSGPDWIVQLQVTHPFRPPTLVDDAVETVLNSGLDSAFAAGEEFHSFWYLSADGKPQRLISAHRQQGGKKMPVYRQLSGLFSMARTELVLAGTMHGEKHGIIPIRDPRFWFEVEPTRTSDA